jgi:hypothetical protein
MPSNEGLLRIILFSSSVFTSPFWLVGANVTAAENTSHRA